MGRLISAVLDVTALLSIGIVIYLRHVPLAPVQQIGTECARQSHHQIRSPQWTPMHLTSLTAQKEDLPFSYYLVLDSHLRHTPNALLAVFVGVPEGDCAKSFSEQLSAMRQHVEFLKRQGLKVHWREIRNIRQWFASTPMQDTDVQHKHVGGTCDITPRDRHWWGAHVSDLLHALSLYHFGGLARDGNLGMLRNPEFLWSGQGPNMMTPYVGTEFLPGPQLAAPWMAAEPRSVIPLGHLFALADLARKWDADRIWPFHNGSLRLKTWPQYDATADNSLSPITLNLLKHGYRMAFVDFDKIHDYNPLSVHGELSAGGSSPRKTVQLPASHTTIELTNLPILADCEAEAKDVGGSLEMCGASKGTVFRRPYSLVVLGVHYIQALNFDDLLSPMTKKQGQQAVINRLDGSMFYHFYGPANDVIEELHNAELASQREMWRYVIDQMCLTLCDEQMMQLIVAKDYKSADALWKSLNILSIST